jgi:hypothetical protein
MVPRDRNFCSHALQPGKRGTLRVTYGVIGRAAPHLCNGAGAEHTYQGQYNLEFSHSYLTVVV